MYGVCRCSRIYSFSITVYSIIDIVEGNCFNNNNVLSFPFFPVPLQMSKAMIPSSSLVFCATGWSIYRVGLLVAGDIPRSTSRSPSPRESNCLSNGLIDLIVSSFYFYFLYDLIYSTCRTSADCLMLFCFGFDVNL